VPLAAVSLDLRQNGPDVKMDDLKFEGIATNVLSVGRGEQADPSALKLVGNWICRRRRARRGVQGRSLECEGWPERVVSVTVLNLTSKPEMLVQALETPMVQAADHPQP
ncbi:unnamed protein product, partial [Effrenium voratum]